VTRQTIHDCPRVNAQLPEPKVTARSVNELGVSRLSSGWTPLELIKHPWVEFSRLEWGFEGRVVHEPWGDTRDGRWHVNAEGTPEALLTALKAEGCAYERRGRG